MERELVCPYRNCGKTYASECSLNLHIKVKHNGGNKGAREALALRILKAHVKGDLSKIVNSIALNLPPGEIQKQADKLGLPDVKETSILQEIYQRIH